MLHHRRWLIPALLMLLACGTDPCEDLEEWVEGPIVEEGEMTTADIYEAQGWSCMHLYSLPKLGIQYWRCTICRDLSVG